MSRKNSKLLGLLVVGLLATGISSLFDRLAADRAQTAGDITGAGRLLPQEDRGTTVKWTLAGSGGLPRPAATPTVSGSPATRREISKAAAFTASALAGIPLSGASRVSHHRGSFLSDQAPRKSSVPSAVRLADNVRLPAALMPRDGAAKPNPPIAAVTADIANTFYQKMRDATATHPEFGSSTRTEVVAGEDDTAVIVNSPVAEEIRETADEHFRALFGEEKYNQQTLSSAVESRLPVESVEPSE